MKRKSECILFVMVILLLTSCMPTGPAISKQSDEEYQKGVRELTYFFHADAPPVEVLQRSDDSAVVILENRGAADIDSGIISLITEEPFVKVMGPTKRRFETEGRTAGNPEGGMEQMRFDLEIGHLPQQRARYDTEILANVCYDYASEMNEEVCIDPDPYGDLGKTEEDRVCALKDLTSSGQGGPIAIDRVKVRMNADGSGRIKPSFTIHIRNKGKGTVVEHSRLTDLCSGGAIRQEDFNQISLYATLRDHPLVCDMDTLQLFKGEATVRCRDEVGVDASLGPFIAPLHIRLTYGYSDTISRKVTIIR
ncbi:MAG: hypothetical protein ACOCWQ_02565 [Nanoarchaeota archaeon]